nr:MAG TPA: hypothetical protein [Caudoviricetes sp.]
MESFLWRFARAPDKNAPPFPMSIHGKFNIDGGQNEVLV